MTDAGTYSIKFVFQNLSQIQAELARFRSDVGGSVAAIGGAADFAKKALVGLAGFGSVAGFASIIKGALDSAAALNDLSIKTGASVESLSRWSDIGRLSSTSVESVAAASNKLSKALATATVDSAGAAQALKALGINFDDFQKLAPDERMKAVAVAMDKFADGSGKTAAAMALFGKQGADLLPFLKDYATSGEFAARITKEQAAAADAFGDNLGKLTLSAGAWRTELAGGMAPALAEASQAFLDVFNGAGGLREEIRRLSADGTIADWTRRTVVALTYVMDAGSGVKRVFQTIGEYIGGQVAIWAASFGSLGEAISKALSGDFKGAWQALKTGSDEVRTITADLGKTISDVWSEETVGQKIRARLAEVKGFGQASEDAKPQVDMRAQLEGNAAASKKLQQAYGSTREALQKYNKETAAAVAQNQKLSDVQKLILRAEELLLNSKGRLTEKDREALRVAIEQARALEQQRTAQEALKKAHDDTAKSLDTSIEGLKKEIEQQREANMKLELGAEALGKLEVAKLREMAATAERNALIAGESELNSDLVLQYMQQAKLLRELADERGKGTHLEMAKQANEEWKKTTEDIEKGLTDALFRAAEQGKSIWATLKETIRGYFNNLVLKPVVSAIMQPVAGAISGLLGSIGLGGTGTGGAGGNLLGTISQVLSGGKSLMELFKGGISTLGENLATSIGTWIYKFGNVVGSNSLREYGIDMAFKQSGTAGGAANGAVSTGATYAAAGLAGSVLGGAISNGYGKSGYTNAGVAIGSLFGPIGAVVGGVIGGIVNAAFGMRPRRYGESGVEGNIIDGNFEGRTFADWTQKGGWFRRNRAGTDFGNVSDDMAAALDMGGAAVYAKVKDYAKYLKIPADSMEEASFRLRVVLTQDAAKNEESIAKAFGDYETLLVSKLEKSLAPFQKVGETLTETLQRLAAIQVFSEAINQFGGIFTRVAQLSLSAKEELIGFAGGMEEFLKKTQSFVESYYSDSEKFGLAAKQLQEQLRAAGITQDVSSKADFRKIVEAVDISTTAGREQLNQLLDIAQAFAPVAQYLEDQKTTLAELADKAPSSALLESVLADQETQAAYQEQLTNQVDTLNTSIIGIGDLIANAIATGNEALLAALSSVASQSATTARLLTRWDNNGQLSTTTTAP